MSTRERYAYDVKSAAQYLCIATSTLYQIAERQEIEHIRTSGKVTTQVRAGKRVAVRVSGRLKFSQDGLDAWIVAHRSPVKRESAAEPVSRPSDVLPMPAQRRFAR